MRTAFCCVVFVALAACLAAQSDGGAITGVVEDAVTHAPVAKARVSLTGGAVRPGPASSTVTTDAGGSYRFDHLPPGSYSVRLRHRAYPSWGPPAEWPVTLSGPETVRVPALQLIPPATVSGRISDEDGDPLESCAPTLIPEIRRSGSSGQRAVFAGDGSYRLEGVRPGRYYVLLQCRTRPFQPRPLLPDDVQLPEWVYPPVFYPASADGVGAQMISLDAGSELSGVDFQARPARAYALEGSAGPFPVSRDVSLFVAAAPRNPLLARSLGIVRAQVDEASGYFRFATLVPGSYRLLVLRRLGGKAVAAAMEQVEVVDRPVRVNVTPRPALTVEGVVERSGEPKTGSRYENVLLIPAETVLQVPIRHAAIDAGGKFRFDDIVPGRWRLNVNVAGEFVSSIRLPDREVINGVLDLTGGPPAGELRVVLSSRMAAVEVMAPPGSLVVASAVDERDLPGMRSYPVDQQGRLLVRDLPPGAYRFSVNGALPGAGRELTLAEGQTATLDLRGR